VEALPTEPMAPQNSIFNPSKANNLQSINIKSLPAPTSNVRPNLDKIQKQTQNCELKSYKNKKEEENDQF